MNLIRFVMKLIECSIISNSGGLSDKEMETFMMMNFYGDPILAWIVPDRKDSKAY